MGLLSRVREQVKERAVDTARKVADRAREVIENRMGLPTSRQEGENSDQGPRFSEAGMQGLEGWESARPRLRQAGLAMHGLLQARFTDSELALRDALDRLEAAARANGGRPGVWSEAADQLARSWQDQNSRILEAWKTAFDGLDQAWLEAGRQVAQQPWKRAWSDAAARFDTVWLAEWDKFQEALEDVCTVLKERFKEIPRIAELEPAIAAGIWQRAGSLVDGGIRRAHGDLWGAWGTQGALMRNSARKIAEGEGDAGQIYPPAFEKIEADFGNAIRVNVQDVRDSWVAAVDQLILGLEGRS